MYEFVDKLLNVALPRVRDFRGVHQPSMEEEICLGGEAVNTKIDYDKIDQVREWTLFYYSK